MERFFPVHRPLEYVGWRNLSAGYQTTTRVPMGHTGAVTREFQIPVICRDFLKPHPSGIFYGENPLDYSFTVVLLEIIFVILASHIVRFLLKPLKQPRVVSDMLGGLVVGPSVFGTKKQFSSCLFPDNAQYVLKNIGLLGFMYFLFITGVKMDLSLVKKAGKKHVCIAVVGVVVPIVIVTVVELIVRKSMDENLAKPSSIVGLSSTLAITNFPVLYPILEELNLLSSEIGRMALSTTVISDAIGISAIISFEAIKQGEGVKKGSLWYILSLMVFLLFLVICIRRSVNMIIERTPMGQAVDQSFVVAILLGVCVSGFLTDMFGVAIGSGPLWLGLVIPDGPPLGTTLVEKSETIMMDILMPSSFALVGLYTDVFAMSKVGWAGLAPVFAIVVTGCLSKMIGTVASAIFFDIPLKDSLTLGLIMSLKGPMELILYLHGLDKLIFSLPVFTFLVLSTVVVTGIATPLISILYDPTKPYMVNNRRTIQHLPPGKELRALLCIHEEEDVAGLIKFLKISNPSVSSPFCIFALHLIELLGRANPLFINHEYQNVPTKYASSCKIHNALKHYQEGKSEFLKLHTFTAVSPQRSMYQDICKLALINEATLIILPNQRECLEPLGGTEIVRSVVRSVNSDVLAHAPCSVGILVDKGHCQEPLSPHSLEHSLHHLVMLFLGGADAREALVYADHMVRNGKLSIILIRFLPENSGAGYERERKLDDGVVTWFWVKNERDVRVTYREVQVRNGLETVAAIHAINHDSIETWILGREQGINPILLDGLTDWTENPELGVIGDYIASPDFGSSASVLVVQQQIMRESRTT